MRLKTLMLTLVCLLALAHATSAAQSRKSAPASDSYPLVGITVTGSGKFAEADIIKTLDLRVGAKVTPADFQQAANRLSATGAFDRVSFKFKPAGRGFVVDYQVEDAQVQFTPCSFDNFVWFTDDELFSAIRARVPLYNGEVPEQGDMLEQVTSALQDLLSQRGISGHVRFLRQGELNRGIEAGMFTVEGAKIVIAELRYPGQTAIAPATLEAASKALIGTPYQRSTVAGFADLNLKPLYFEDGYLAVQFGTPAVTVQASDARQTSVAVAIPITPGPQFRAGEMRWTGTKAFRSSDLAERMHWKGGAIANGIQVQKDLDALRQLYESYGYLRVGIESRPMMVVNPPIANYDITITEGDQYHMGALRIEGITPVIRDQLHENWKLREAEPFNPFYVSQYLKENSRLIGPGYKVLVDPAVDDKNKIVDVTIKFEQRERVQ